MSSVFSVQVRNPCNLKLFSLKCSLYHDSRGGGGGGYLLVCASSIPPEGPGGLKPRPSC